LKVIGASALSPPGAEPASPLALSWTLAKSGYSDVGFRLAFTAPAAAPKGLKGGEEELGRVIHDAAYLAAP
jgi:hypothetical protein